MERPNYITGDYTKSVAFGNKSRLVYGTSGLGGVWGSVQEQESIEAILFALENKISVFDTAPSYSNAELYLGKALKQWNGEKPFISTKIGRLQASNAFDIKLDYSTEGMKRSLANSLELLGLSSIDLLFLHEPHLVPEDEIERIINDLKDFKSQGLVQNLGVGGNPPLSFMPYITKENFDVVSGYLRMDACNLNVFNGEIQQYKKEGIAYYAASALHFSLLGNRFEKYKTEGVDGDFIVEKDLQNAIAVKAIADDLDMSLPTLAQRYLFSINEADRIVMGARNLAQITATVKDWELGVLPKEIFEKITDLIVSA
ncbi:aldo/keto reductase [Pedobacter changchengzhani]|uniref:Aldo/keto reductase n=1 Tax=Pedobacter changchengzhani TaxID=2529274 RepID=A0A4R5MLW0_9SPHI|nr:aldo/keto reductase [Pedobacter changchengzhani]TDG36245.1 aldo/keto reductase [Pedobacter changchengzhani]